VLHPSRGGGEEGGDRFLLVGARGQPHQRWGSDSRHRAASLDGACFRGAPYHAHGIRLPAAAREQQGTPACAGPPLCHWPGHAGRQDHRAHLTHDPLWWSPVSRLQRPPPAAGARGERPGGGPRSPRGLQEVQGFPAPDGRVRAPEPLDQVHHG
jgi:hypothetical protein